MVHQWCVPSTVSTREFDTSILVKRLNGSVRIACHFTVPWTLRLAGQSEGCMMSNKELTLIVDQAELKTAITAHGKKRAGMDRETQRLALSAISVFQQHGNVFYINHLYANMGKGARHVALTAWLLEFGGVKANTAEGKTTTPFVKDGDKSVDMIGAAKTPWYDMKPSQAPDQVVDLLKLTLAVIKKAQGEGKQLVHGAMLTELTALAEKYAPEEEVAEAAETE